MCKFPIYLHFIISLVSHFGQVPYLFTFHQIFSVPLCASSPFFSISLYLQYPILGKFPIYLHSIRSSVSHFGQVPYLFTFHYIFSVPFGASSLSIYIPLDLQCPIMCKFPNFLCFIISSVSHSGQVPYSFTFHYIFSVPLSASSPYFYISFYIQCPILCKFPNFFCFVISSVSHSGQVPHNFVLHYIFSVPLRASSLSFYLSLFPLCTIMCKFSFFLPFIISSVSHYMQVLHLFTFHYIFSVPFGASSLSIYIPLDLQCPILGKFPPFVTFHYIFNGLITSSTLSLRLIISFACHYVQVPYLFTLHYIFSVPLCASSLSIYISLDLQCPIMCKFSIFFHFIISLVSHFGQVPYLFTFHQIFSVPFWASSLSIYISLYLQCPILGKYPPIYLSLFTICASSPSFYLSLYVQCPIMCKFSIFLHSIISLVSHYVQVPYLFTFFQCLQVLHTFHYISVPFWASTLQLYVSLFLQCPIMSVLHIFTFHFVFSVQLCGSSQTSYVSLYIYPVMCKCPITGQVPIMCKFPIYLHFIRSSVSHYVQVLHFFPFHYIFSVPFWASSLSIYIPLDLQCPILGKYPIILCFIIYLVSHYVQVPYLFTFHYFLCVPLCASSPSFYLSLYVQCPIMCKFSIFLHSIISLVSHFGQVPYLFTFHQIFSVPFWASNQ